MSRTAAAARAASSDFVLSRELDAPLERVWRAFTDAEHMKQWFSPKGFIVKSAKMEFRPGGKYHYCLVAPDGREMWGKAVYREIAEPERLVWVNSFSDPQGGISRHPMAPDWPLEMLTTVAFSERGGKTAVSVRWAPINPTDAGRRAFDGGHDSMRQGWGGTFDQLAAYLAKG
jgi:uncharacterized protein YndB with AHSA1/START domain